MTPGQWAFFSVGIVIFLAIFTIRFFLRNRAPASPYEDARRFARLQMTQIKLYEGNKVDRGLRDNNLAQVLETEIEEARREFHKRVANEYSAVFDEAVVEILADGDRSKLGSI